MAIGYSKKEVKKLFKEQLSKRLEFMESERKALKLYSLISLFCLLFLVVLFVILSRNPNNFFYIVKSYTYLTPRLLVPVVMGQVVFFIYFLHRRKMFKRKFKKRVVAPIIETFIPGARYQATKGLTEDDYRNSELIKSSHNTFFSEDFVNFKYRGLDIEFSEIRTERVSRGKGQTRRIVFKGFLLKGELPLDFNYKTIIVPDIGESYLGSFLGRFLQKRNVFREEELVALESSSFEKKYAVYASDQIEARRILTPRIMEKVLNYNKKAKQSLYLSFISNHLYLALPTKHNYFEPKIWEQMSFSDVIKMVRILRVMTEILDVFELGES